MKKLFISLLFLFAGVLIFISCKKGDSCEGCDDVNKPPIALAGSDQVVTLPADSVSIDGSASNDPDGRISEWLWTRISGPASFSMNNPSASGTVVKNLTTGVYGFELRVTDNEGLTARDTLQVIVVDPLLNQPPIANAGPDQSITLPVNTVSLDGSGSSDPENNIISYYWTTISGPPSLYITTPQAIQSQVTDLIQGVYQFELRVMDAGGLFSRDTMQVTVHPAANQPPDADAGPDLAIILPNNSVTLNGTTSTDPENNIIAFLWTKISGPSTYNIVDANAVQTPINNLVQGVYHFELKVTDAGGLFSRDTVQVTVNTAANQPPVANAGPDQTITLPNNSVTVNGSNSTDPENNIVAFLWTKISGPYSFNFVNAGAVQSQVTNLIQGVYQFELKVTDAGGLFSRDTMQVNVNAQPPPPNSCPPTNRPLINAQLISVGNLSIGRRNMATVSAGNKLFFAGGFTGSGYSSRVDIYDIALQSWSIAELSIARHLASAVAAGNKVFFAGGYSTAGTSSRVDIYDLTTQTWSVSELSQARAYIETAAVGSKVFFAGGNFSSRVDIYDISTNTWSTANLSEAKMGFTATTAGNKVYFAGGDLDNYGPASDRIDIYDNATASWSTSTLNAPKAYHAAFFKNGKIFWMGGAIGLNTLPENGDEVTCQVEVKDVNTQVSSFTNLAYAKYYNKAFEKDNKFIVVSFYSGWLYWQDFDIYDLSSNSWSIGLLPQSLSSFASVVSANNGIYVAGGWSCINGNCQYLTQVWRLEF